MSEDSVLRIVRFIECLISHMILNDGQLVRGAGTVTFGSDGTVTEIDNITSHYGPDRMCGADLHAGTDAFEELGVPIPPAPIKQYMCQHK